MGRDAELAAIFVGLRLARPAEHQAALLRRRLVASPNCAAKSGHLPTPRARVMQCSMSHRKWVSYSFDLRE